MDELSELAKGFLQRKEALLLSTSEVISSSTVLEGELKSIEEIEIFINNYSYNRCHELTYWISEQLPDLKVAVFHGSKSRRPAHSAIVLPSGLLFDAQGFREVQTVFEEYNQLTLEYRGETIDPARFVSREQLFDVMIDVTASFTTKSDVEASFQGRKGNLFSRINTLFELIDSHLVELEK